jgi:hypothetical protein
MTRAVLSPLLVALVALVAPRRTVFSTCARRRARVCDSALCRPLPISPCAPAGSAACEHAAARSPPPAHSHGAQPDAQRDRMGAGSAGDGARGRTARVRAQIATGLFHACATTEGSVGHCWGYNGCGGLAARSAWRRDHRGLLEARAVGAAQVGAGRRAGRQEVGAGGRRQLGCARVGHGSIIARGARRAARRYPSGSTTHAVPRLTTRGSAGATTSACRREGRRRTLTRGRAPAGPGRRRCRPAFSGAGCGSCCPLGERVFQRPCARRSQRVGATRAV